VEYKLKSISASFLISFPTKWNPRNIKAKWEIWWVWGKCQKIIVYKGKFEGCMKGSTSSLPIKCLFL
jgi:hypothetical protein